MPTIHVLSGSDAGRSFDVAHGATFGRDAACAVVLHDTSVSRRHARLELDEGRWRVVDTGSRNGVALNGARASVVALDEGVEFQLGDVLLRFGAPRVASTAKPVVAPSDPGEIVLEGDWSAPLDRLPPPSRPAIVPRDLERTQERPRPVVPPSSSSPSSPPQRLFVSRAPGALPPIAPARGASGASTRGVAMRTGGTGQGADASRALLQYSKVEARAGFAASDLAQQPLWARLALALGALALFAGLAWGAFHVGAFFKGKTTSVEEPADETIDEPR